ncbi:polysaccharide deacetylase family protein [Singulisphaera acidiphila]|uniref:Putative xylanase/chitin deacetylase n=1 Tax=Singulisphaera acidiphila (strain ATCC BAA-1392 / DSM 18658 / VKM B-2454 / MOB10) TaxID=886293 RepID=L0DBN2_SINAD|nr:polysaccharide deacetylase family protein [Singulisphaera acidiphila]AGA26784.1 putative xylanase/chitin deacetylase [Singulisphaera acidiphila DSM 18658]
MIGTHQLRRIAVFVGSDNTPSTIEDVERIARAFPHWTITVFQEKTRRRWSLNLRVNRRRAVPEPTSLDLAGHWPRPVPRSPGSPVGLPEALDRIDLPNIHYRLVPSLHSSATLREVSEARPCLGIALVGPIFEHELFEIPKYGTINISKGLLTDHPGIPTGFSEIHDGVERTGVSIQWMGCSPKTGGRIHQRALEVPPYTTPVGLRFALDALGTEVLLEALRQLDDGTATIIPQANGASPLSRHPSSVMARDVRQRVPLSRRLRSVIKVLALLGYVYLYVPPRNLLRRLTGSSHVSVLLYHRVDDGFLDTVTVGVEQFARQMSLLARRYDVLDLPEFLASLGRPRRRPAVVLTFDDGYEDNFQAALILRRLGLPCTFFLSTRIVGTPDEAFPHDIKRLGRRVPALSWDQVRLMQSWGFRFGNHTCRHVNLAEVPVEEAVAEIVTASTDLERELGDSKTIRVLAYPYGKRMDMSDEVRNRLGSLGCTHCMSAYGDTNPPDFKAMNVLRQGVDHSFSDLRFLSVVEGWKV